jgi:hypothetical protein
MDMVWKDVPLAMCQFSAPTGLCIRGCGDAPLPNRERKGLRNNRLAGESVCATQS